MDDNKFVCYCMSVTEGAIRDAVAAGASTVEEVQEVTGAGSVCGACVEEVTRLVEEFSRERKQQQ